MAKTPAPRARARTAPEKPNGLVDVHGEPSYTLAHGDVELSVTRRGGHMGPARFRLGNRWVSPYSLAPWRPAEVPADTEPLLQVLRGDMFCLPFGESEGIPYTHGDTANLAWTLADRGPAHLELEMGLKTLKGGHVRKLLRLRQGHTAIYQEHIVSGLEGAYNVGNHPILEFPAGGGPFHVSVSPFRFGGVMPVPFQNPAIGEYGILKTGARFKSLAEVPLATGGTTDLGAYPAREGYEDLVMVSSKPGRFAWTAATLDGYVWVSLKDPGVLPSTLFWISNGGRHQSPWNGRHRRRLGLEEVCGYFCLGLGESRRDALRGLRIPTTMAFSRRKPTSIRIIHLVRAVPKGFGAVTEVSNAKAGEVAITGSGGATVRAPVDWGFLYP